MQNVMSARCWRGPALTAVSKADRGLPLLSPFSGSRGNHGRKLRVSVCYVVMGV